MLNHQVHINENADSWVVFIHGAGGSIKTWKYQIADFTRHFNLLLIDLRDHGDSKSIQPDFPNYTFELISKDIDEVVTSVGIESAHFVTLSFGSVLIQDYTSRYSAKVRSVVFSGAIFKGNLAIKGFVHLARFFNLFLSYKTMYSMFSYLLMPKKRNQLARRIYQRQAGKLTQKEYMKWVGLYKEFFRLLSDFYHKTFTINSLVIMGSDDFVFLKAAKSFTNKQRLVDLEILAVAGHICNIDQWQLFNDTAIRFIISNDTQYKNSRPDKRSIPVNLY
ncbi:MAG: alpha/beta hydrolase [Bacteroidota bacterium]